MIAAMLPHLRERVQPPGVVGVQSCTIGSLAEKEQAVLR